MWKLSLVKKAAALAEKSELESIANVLSKREMTFNQMCREFRHAPPRMLGVLTQLASLKDKELVEVQGNLRGVTTYILRPRGLKVPLIRKATVDCLVRLLREAPRTFEQLCFEMASEPFYVHQLLRVAVENYDHVIHLTRGSYRLLEGRALRVAEALGDEKEITGSGY